MLEEDPLQDGQGVDVTCTEQSHSLLVASTEYLVQMIIYTPPPVHPADPISDRQRGQSKEAANFTETQTGGGASGAQSLIHICHYVRQQEPGEVDGPRGHEVHQKGA